VYVQNGTVLKLGHGFAAERMKKLLSLDRLQSAIDTCTNSQQRRRMKKQFAKKVNT